MSAVDLGVLSAEVVVAGREEKGRRSRFLLTCCIDSLPSTHLALMEENSGNVLLSCPSLVQFSCFSLRENVLDAKVGDVAKGVEHGDPWRIYNLYIMAANIVINMMILLGSILSKKCKTRLSLRDKTQCIFINPKWSSLKRMNHVII